MPETVPVIAGTNHFSLGAKFGTSNSTTTETQEENVVKSGTGNYLCSSYWDKKTDYSQEAGYCGGAAVDIVTDLSTLYSAFGGVANSKVPTTLRIHFEAAKAATVTVEGHNHAANPHTTGMRVANLVTAAIIPAASGYGVPALITVSGTVSAVAADVTFELDHIDKSGATGDHFGGQSTMCKCTLSVEYEGKVTAATAGNWLNILIASSDSNTDTPTSSVTAEQYIDTAVPT
jgi:hypothetical protein